MASSKYANLKLDEDKDTNGEIFRVLTTILKSQALGLDANQSIQQLDSITKKLQISTKENVQPQLDPLPHQSHCGKLSAEQVRSLALRCNIRSSLVMRQDNFESDSFVYLQNFWLYTPNTIYTKLVESNAADACWPMNSATVRLNHLPLTDNERNTIELPPTDIENDNIEGRQRFADLLAISHRPDIHTFNLSDEVSPIIPEHKDTNWNTWQLTCVFAHSTVNYTNKYFDNCVVKNDDADINWPATINAFIDLSMKYRLSDVAKLNMIKSLVRTHTPAYYFYTNGATLTEIYTVMRQHNSHISPKDKIIKRLRAFKRHPGQPLTASLQAISKLYKDLNFPNQTVSLDPNDPQFNTQYANYVANCLYSLTSPTIRVQIIESNREIMNRGRHIDVMQCARIAEQMELDDGFHMESLPLYTQLSGPNIENTAVNSLNPESIKLNSILSNKQNLGQPKTVKVNSMIEYITPQNEIEEEEETEELINLRTQQQKEFLIKQQPKGPSNNDTIPFDGQNNHKVVNGSTVVLKQGQTPSEGNTTPPTQGIHMSTPAATPPHVTVDLSAITGPNRQAQSGASTPPESEASDNPLNTLKARDNKDPWLLAKDTIKKMRDSPTKPFKWDCIFSNDMSPAQEDKVIKEFDLSPQFFALGQLIFNVIGYPTAPVLYSDEGVKTMLERLNIVDAPMFYKKIFFNCPSMAPIFDKCVHRINRWCVRSKTHYVLNNVSVNTVTFEKEPKDGPREDTRGGRDNNRSYNTSRSNSRGRDRFRSRSRSFNRNDRSDSEVRYNRSRSRDSGSGSGTSTGSQKLIVKIPGYADNRCFPLVCQGECKGKSCKKCKGAHSTHNCGYYLLFSRTPCKYCPDLFHCADECQRKSVVFPDSQKN